LKNNIVQQVASHGDGKGCLQTPIFPTFFPLQAQPNAHFFG
jgi:hypothetical protein